MKLLKTAFCILSGYCLMIWNMKAWQKAKAKTKGICKGQLLFYSTVFPVSQKISLYKSKESLCVCVCMCGSNISAHQDQTDLRFSAWLLLGSRVWNITFVWTTMIQLINYFINSVPIPLALLTVATIVTCAPEPITAHHSHVPTRANHSRAHFHDIP